MIYALKSVCYSSGEVILGELSSGYCGWTEGGQRGNRLLGRRRGSSLCRVLQERVGRRLDLSWLVAAPQPGGGGQGKNAKANGGPHMFNT